MKWFFLKIKKKKRKAGRGSPNWPASMIPPPLLDLGEYNKDKLRKLTDEALKKGVFGAPTFLVNKKIFWGQDRLSYAIEESKK